MCKGQQQREDASVPTAVVFVNKACFDVPVRAVWHCWVQSGNKTSCCYNDSPAGAAESNSSSICILRNYSIHLPKVNCQEQLSVLPRNIRWRLSTGLPCIAGKIWISHTHRKYVIFMPSWRTAHNAHLFLSYLSVPSVRRNTRVTQRDTWYVEADSSGTRSLINQQTPPRLINMLGHTRTFVLHHRHWRTRMRRCRASAPQGSVKMWSCWHWTPQSQTNVSRIH